MHGCFRRFAAAFFAGIVLLGSAMPAVAGRESEMALQHADPIVDLMVLRPIGLAAMVIGTALFVVPVAPIALVTRPDGVPLAFKHLVINPARYVWADPLGAH